MTTTIADLNARSEIQMQNSSPVESAKEKEIIKREIRPIPDRYRNALGKFKVDRLARCIACGKCAELCPYGVHSKPEGYTLTLRPQDYRCIGPSCSETDHYCIDQCPVNALVLRMNPNVECLGDPRWPSDLVLATWHMAETGHTPPPHLEYRCGDSGGGFDRMRFRFELPELEALPSANRKEEIGIQPNRAEIDTGLDLNRRNDGRPPIHIDIPVYGGGMSFGSVSIHTILAKARAAMAWNSFSWGWTGQP